MSLFPFDDRDGIIWYDGKFCAWRDAKVHVLTHGLHYASSVFEGGRVYGGIIFKLEEHTRRLFDSARIMGMTIPYTEDEINQACRTVVADNKIVDGYLRPVVWRGSEMMAVSAQNCTVHAAIATWQWPSYFGKEARENGLRIMTAKWRRPAPDTAPVHAKAAGLYMIATMNKHAAEAAGFQDALMLDYRGLVAEATGANFFMVRDGVIQTPIPDCFLDGITRRTVMELARQRGYTVIERRIAPDELAMAEEMFLTGSAAEVTPIGQFDDMTFSVGPVTRNLMDDYDNFVRNTASVAAA